MILQARCKSCNELIEKNYLVKDRIGLVKDYGEEQHLSCPHCGADNVCYADDFRATKNLKQYYQILTVALILCAIIAFGYTLVYDVRTILGWIICGLFSAIPLSIMLIYFKMDTENQSHFNRIKLKGHVASPKLTSTASKVNIAQVKNTKGITGHVQKINQENLPSKKKENKGK